MNNIDKTSDNLPQTFEELSESIENRIREVDKEPRFNKRVIFANNVLMALIIPICFLLYAGFNYAGLSIDAADWWRGYSYFLTGSFLVLLLAVPDSR